MSWVYLVALEHEPPAGLSQLWYRSDPPCAASYTEVVVDRPVVFAGGFAATTCPSASYAYRQAELDGADGSQADDCCLILN